MSGDDFIPPMFRDKSIKKKANASEKRTASRFGLRQQPASGAGDRKGDFTRFVPSSAPSSIKTRKFVGDEKSTKHESISVTTKMIAKIKRDMHEEGASEWFVPLVFQGECLGVIISPDLFKELMG